MNSAAILALAALAGTAPPVSSPSRLPPIDQCATVAGFPEFRSTLLDAIKRRDSNALLALISDDILATFGQGGSGKREFTDTWNLAKPGPDKTSAVWDALGKALGLGCAWSGDALVSPSIIAQIDPMVDGFTTVLAVAPGAALRTAPSQEAPVLAALNWELLTLRETEAGDDWFAVARADGAMGFVRKDQVRSVIDYRAVFERRDGRWLITAFVAGD